MTVQIKHKNIGKEIIKLPWKYNLNSKCTWKENSSKGKKMRLSKYRHSLERIMPGNSSKKRKLKILTKRIYDILHTRPPSYKKCSEASLLENTFTTSTSERNSYVLCRGKISNSSNLLTNSVELKQYKP